MRTAASLRCLVFVQFFTFGQIVLCEHVMSSWENINDLLTLMSLTCVSLRDSILSLVACCQHDFNGSFC